MGAERVAAAGAAGLAVGFAAGWWAAPAPAPAPAPEPVAARPAPAPAPSTRAPTTVRAPRREELERENSELRAMVADLEKKLADETLGVAAEWSDDVPEHLAPEGFTRQVRKAVAECDAGGDLIDVDCREPPCYAVFRVRASDWWDRFVNDCPAWADVYGRGVGSAGEFVDCGDGRKERVQLIAPVGIWDYVDKPRPDDSWNETKRMRARTEDAVGSWTCLPP